jgi:hypothetical protein
VVLGVPFIGSRWLVEAAWREDGGYRWWVITSSIFNIETKGGESMGRPIELGKRRQRERRFGSASRTRWRAADGNARGDGSPGQAVVISSDQGERKALGWAGDGPRIGCELGRRGNFHRKI